MMQRTTIPGSAKAAEALRLIGKLVQCLATILPLEKSDDALSTLSSANTPFTGIENFVSQVGSTQRQTLSGTGSAIPTSISSKEKPEKMRTAQHELQEDASAVCDKPLSAMTLQHDVNTHMKSNMQSYRCNVCNKNYSCKWNLTRHNNAKHP